MKKLLSITLVLALVFSLAACGGDGDTASQNADADKQDSYVLKIGSTIQDDSASGVALLEYFKPYIEEKSDGRITVEVYNNSVLGGDRQLFEALQLNTVQASFGPLSVLANFDSNFTVADLPFLFNDKEIAYAALDGEFGTMLSAKLPDIGMRLLSYGENAFRNISNSKKPIETMDDMKGMKIRVMESPAYINTMKALGANGTPIAFNELYTALQQGTVDGQDNGVVLTYTAKLYEVQKYYTFTRHCYAANAFVVSEEFWKSLPEDLQQVVADGSNYATENQRRLNTEMEEEYLGYMEDSGVKVNTMSEEERAKWKEATASVYDTLADSISPDILAAAKEVNEKYGKQ